MPLAIALRFAPCHNRLCGNMSPLTASVNESSVGAPDVLVVTVEVLVVALVIESVEPDAQAASAKTITQNLINRRKCTRNNFENS
jgi:hypothetical protein